MSGSRPKNRERRDALAGRLVSVLDEGCAFNMLITAQRGTNRGAYGRSEIVVPRRLALWECGESARPSVGMTAAVYVLSRDALGRVRADVSLFPARMRPLV